MAGQRRGGIISLQLNGEMQDAKGAFSYNLGRPKRTGIVGSDGKLHGYKEEGQAGYIEGEIIDRATLDLAALTGFSDGTVTLELANGKVIVLRNAFYASEGEGNTEEGAIKVRFEGSAEEIQ
jgi:hypothetical protein